MKQRKYWIDATKALCMITVYLMHSEIYYGTGGIEYGYILKPFYVNAFFIISGYLFFSKHMLTKDQTDFKGKEYCQALTNLTFRLILPTVIFSTIIYIPKNLFHDNTLSTGKYFFDVFGGICYWFTSALVVAQFILLTLLLHKSRSLWFYVIVTSLLFALGFTLNLRITTTEPAAYFPWFYRTGLEYTGLMSVGGIYAKYEKEIDRAMKPYGLIICCIVYFVTMGYTWNTEMLKMLGLGGKVNMIGFLAILCGTILIISFSKILPYIKWIAYIGQNSIIFYFFAGVMPAIVGKTAIMLSPQKTYIITILVAGCSIICGTIVTQLINRYLPFLVDLRKLKQWKVKD
jgi:fucose 4-O-acetylase-like acetyltransferase